ncbi:MAG TPA: recombinase family protein [Tepidisphaeraceae bacterium]|jgi:DNA invertase Pin-like site-specific DNA recombinase
MKEKSSYTGRKYLSLARCSTNQQADTSIPDQLKLLRAFGDENGMIYTDSITLDGVTGSVPGARTDIEQIIERKKKSDDFDILLVQDLSRFTRSGAEHGAKLEYDLNAAGIDVIYVTDRLPEGDQGSVFKSLGFYAAQQMAKSLSFAVTRGLMSSLEQGRIAHSLYIPYGIDRLMVSLDNTPLHIIRNLSDGTQQKLHFETGEVLTTFESERGKNKAMHYRMQSNEKVVLIPGAPERIEAVRHMFRRRLIDGWAGFRIARELDDMGIRSGNGKPWSVSSINHILENPVYTGIGIANRYSQGIYNRRSKNSPMPSMTDRKSLANRKQPKQQIRPREEWIEVEHPMLKDYLGDLRERAVMWLKEQLKKQEPSRTKKPASKDRHIDSSYFLKGILKSTDGHPLTGRTVGTPKARYYAIHRGFTTPKRDKTMRRLIPADQLETTVLNILRDMLLSTPDLKSRLVHQIEVQRKQKESSKTDLAKLEKEKLKISQQIELVIDSLGSVGKDAAKSKLQQLEAELTTVVEQIDQARHLKKSDDRTADVVADDMIVNLTKIASTIKKLPAPTLRSLLTTLISRLEVDMRTKTIEFDVAIPAFMDKKALCLEDKAFQSFSNQAQFVITLDSAICTYCRVGRHPCFECTRIRKAA